MFPSNGRTRRASALPGSLFLGVDVLDCFSDQSLVGDHGGEQWVYRVCGKLKLAICCEIEEWPRPSTGARRLRASSNNHSDVIKVAKLNRRYPRGTRLPERADASPNRVELRSLGASAMFGLSTQTTAYQREAVERLHLPFPLLSDSGLVFTRTLCLPTFEFEPMERNRRPS